MKRNVGVNLRSPDVMASVQAQVESHYRSTLIEKIRANGSRLAIGSTTICLAKEFGFCYGVERAIDLAYAARKVFPVERFFLIGEIIHNPLVNEHIAELGILNLLDADGRPKVDELVPEDVVIVPAFGAELSLVESIKARGCRIVDTTCGDVMSVWRRVRQNAAEEVTSIIHGKVLHEETKATVSRIDGHYLVVLDQNEADKVCDYILGRSQRDQFLCEFSGRHSDGFDPDRHLLRIGIANQTTMFRDETEAIQERLRAALTTRDGDARNFRLFDTICGATQVRQDALKELLGETLDLLLVVGGYNSSNTTHLAEIGSEKSPTFFIGNKSCLLSKEQIRHYDLSLKQEVITENLWLPEGTLRIGITAGASCPNTLIDEVIRRVLDLRGEIIPDSAR